MSYPPLRRNEDRFDRPRARMIERLKSKGIDHDTVLRAMTSAPRHLFVEEALEPRAYDDHALPISCGQTISQPYMVARMTALLDPRKHHRVLEIGSGSGYQTAILARLAGQVYALERIPELAEWAQLRLRQLGIRNATISPLDGTLGWPDHAPYDRILAAAFAPHIPEPLVDQLVPGGVLVMPIGREGAQRLIKLRRGEEENTLEDHGPCIFVKLVGEHGWHDPSLTRRSVDRILKS